MGETAVARPTVLVRADPGDDLAVAAQAVFLNDLGAMGGNFYGFRDPACVEGDKIPSAVHGLPHQVPGQGVVGQVAVYAFNLSMDAGVEPGFVLGLHDVAAAAEFRGFGFGVESGGAESQKDSQGSGHAQDDQDNEACSAC